MHKGYLFKVKLFVKCVKKSDFSICFGTLINAFHFSNCCSWFSSVCYRSLLKQLFQISFYVPASSPTAIAVPLVSTDTKIGYWMSKLLSQSPDTNCDLDPIPTFILKQCSHILLPTITNIINLSLSTGIFPDQFKNCPVHPHLQNLCTVHHHLKNFI